MAKKVQTKRTTTHEAELRRWCIEQAIRWPMHGGYGGGAVGAVGGYVPAAEANIIDRAERLMKWVTKA